MTDEQNKSTHLLNDAEAATREVPGLLAASAKSRLEALFANRTVLCDGAMGTALYAKGIFINRCFDELCLSQPEMVRSIHEEYLQAGAEIIETNTFGANPFRLARYGLADKTREINEAGERIARQAVAQLQEKQAGLALVAGSVGPLGIRLEPLSKTSLEEAQRCVSQPDRRADRRRTRGGR